MMPVGISPLSVLSRIDYIIILRIRHLRHFEPYLPEFLQSLTSCTAPYTAGLILTERKYEPTELDSQLLSIVYFP